MLSSLQLKAARLIADELKDTNFALAGGAALITHGVVSRATQDLDFFGRDLEIVLDRLPSIIQSLETSGISVTIERSDVRFVRLVLSKDSEICEVDFGRDARVIPEVEGPFSSLVTVQELAADKVLAIFGRALARDFVDLAALLDIIPIEMAFELAKAKDRGFNLEVFKGMTYQFDRRRREEFDVDDVRFDNLKNLIQNWRETCDRLANDPRFLI